MILQRNHEAHDRTFYQARALCELHKVQGRVPNLKRGQNGQHTISRRDTTDGGSWTRFNH
ncbi:hypothetical protein OA77_26870 [Pseudomonas coronafaciens]|nr:hypothetical protein OA77_26870 [Pseudomonas coronafaciens]